MLYVSRRISSIYLGENLDPGKGSQLADYLAAACIGTSD